MSVRESGRQRGTKKSSTRGVKAAVDRLGHQQSETVIMARLTIRYVILYDIWLPKSIESAPTPEDQ